MTRLLLNIRTVADGQQISPPGQDWKTRANVFLRECRGGRPRESAVARSTSTLLPRPIGLARFARPSCPGGENSSGFSLLELIVAIVLAGLSFSVLFSSMSTSLRNVSRLTAFERHVEQAKSKLGELELVSGLHPGDHSEGEFEDGTRWRFEVFPYILPPVTLASSNAPSVVRITLTLEWQGRSGRQSWTIERYRAARADLTTASLQQQIDALR